MPAAVVTSKRIEKKKTVKKQVKPVIPEADSTEAAGAAVSTAAVDTTGNTPPPPGAAASSAAAASIAPAPAADAPAVENHEVNASKREMGIGGWLLFALAVAALFTIITLFRRRRTRTRGRSRTSIVDHGTLTPELQPVTLLSQELKPSLEPRS